MQGAAKLVGLGIQPPGLQLCGEAKIEPGWISLVWKLVSS